MGERSGRGPCSRDGEGDGAVKRSYRAWISAEIFFALNIATVLSFAIVERGLAAALSLDDAALGGLGASFFVSYAIAQLVLGSLFGRVPVRWMMTASALVAALGAALLAVSHSYAAAVLARVAMGGGFSTAFVGVIYVVRRDHAPLFPFLTALSQSLSNLTGALVGLSAAVTPLFADFRSVFAVLAVLIVASAVSMAVCLAGSAHGAPPADRGHVTKEGFFRTALIAARSPHTWICAVYVAGLFGTVLAYADLWNITFQEVTFGLPSSEASLINASLPAGLTLGGIASGGWANRSGFAMPARIFAWVGLVLLGVMAVHPVDTALAAAMMLAIGAALSASTIGLASLKVHLPPQAVSVATSIVLTIAFLHGGLLGTLVGFDYAGSGADVFTRYRLALVPLVVSVLMAALASLFFRNSAALRD